MAAELAARLAQLYEDLATYDTGPVGAAVATVYNALLAEVKGLPNIGNGTLKPFQPITQEETGRTLRLLVGQLRLVAAD